MATLADIQKSLFDFDSLWAAASRGLALLPSMRQRVARYPQLRAQFDRMSSGLMSWTNRLAALKKTRDAASAWVRNVLNPSGGLGVAPIVVPIAWAVFAGGVALVGYNVTNYLIEQDRIKKTMDRLDQIQADQGVNISDAIRIDHGQVIAAQASAGGGVADTIFGRDATKWLIGGAIVALALPLVFTFAGRRRA